MCLMALVFQWTPIDSSSQGDMPLCVRLYFPCLYLLWLPVLCILRLVPCSRCVRPAVFHVDIVMVMAISITDAVVPFCVYQKPDCGVSFVYNSDTMAVWLLDLCNEYRNLVTNGHHDNNEDNDIHWEPNDQQRTNKFLKLKWTKVHS